MRKKIIEVNPEENSESIVKNPTRVVKQPVKSVRDKNLSSPGKSTAKTVAKKSPLVKQAKTTAEKSADKKAKFGLHSQQNYQKIKRLLEKFDPTDTPFTGLTEIDPRKIRVIPQEESTPAAAYRHVNDALLLDGSSRLNLATFVTTWMEPQARLLMAEGFDKNAIDHDEYPATSEVEQRCVDIVARLFNAPLQEEEAATGVSTVGSSEAVMLAALALKWRWRQKREKAGESTDKPNLVLGTNVQVVWEKFCRYFDVEPIYVPIEPGKYTFDPEKMVAAVNEHTIGVVAILGTTFTGEYEDILGLSHALDKLAKQGGPNVPIHVDGASGGFVAPFLSPKLRWDFRVPRVVSINASGHKYGLVYPGIGWVIWRSSEYLPEELVFKVNYLGGELPTFTLNFSKSASQIIGQYYNFIRFGFDGYQRILSALQGITLWMLDKFQQWKDTFEIVSSDDAIPLIALVVKADLPFTAYDLSHELRAKGWQVPAYSMPANAEEVVVLRIVVRAGFSAELGARLIEDFHDSVDFLNARGGRGRKDQAFAH